MKTLIFLLVISFSFVIAKAETYNIGHKQVVFTDSSRNHRQVLTEVYYPTKSGGENVEFINTSKKFATVVFGHGYQLTYKSYLWLKDSLVPKGYIVAFPRTEEELFPNHTDFAKDIAFIVKMFSLANSTPASPLFQRLNNRYAVSGHSMGGGCALLSVQYNSSISTVAVLAAAETNPSAIAACNTIKIPALIFAGKQDCVTPPLSNQIPMYDNLKSTCKNYIEINKAKHCHWAVNDFTCTLGEITCGGFATDYKQTLTVTSSLLIPWLNAILYFDKQEAISFNKQLRSADNFTFKQDCSIGSSAFSKPNITTVNVYPNPSILGEPLFALLPLKESSEYTITITNTMGNVIMRTSASSINGRLALPSKNLQEGFYILSIQNKESIYKSSFINKY